MIASGGKNNAIDEIKAGGALQGNYESLEDPEGIINRLSKSGDDFWGKYKVARSGCAGCPVHHFYVFDVPGVGEAGPKCAAWASFANPLWNTDHEVMFRAGALCNRYGLDFVSTSSIISFLMMLYHRGIITDKDTDGFAIRRGDRDVILTTIHKLGRQEGFGRLFREGIKSGAALIGRGAEELALHIHGREMQVGQFPGSNGSALAYAVVKDPLDALPLPELLWHADVKAAEDLAEWLCGQKEAAYPDRYEHKAALVRAMKIRTTAAELLGLCKWLLLNMTPSLEVPAKLFSLATGVETSESSLLEAAERVGTLERAVNAARGQRRKDDTLPSRIFDMPVPGGPFKGRRIDRGKFEGMVKEFYTLNGWDNEGIPLAETFTRLGLANEWGLFKRNLAAGMKNG
jgi:aldehyde:ferredoxin oxidoreductase